jgi:predicted ATPase
VFFVDLSAVRETEDVPAGIARAVGLSETSGQPPLEELTERLRQQHILLVLDNFEQVTTAAPMTVELLEDCQGLKLLVTSREAEFQLLKGDLLLAVPKRDGADPGPGSSRPSPPPSA